MNLLHAFNLFSTLTYPKAGERRLLDNMVEVIVIKSFPRSLTKCLVEDPEKRFLLVDPARLTQADCAAAFHTGRRSEPEQF